ncbi:DNA-binding transcriptional regulator YhcF, GntR family [Devosia lucknowensis]|uniref:DNA-binding transcriptional regulator YhcF, GntR family n=1 Tax=Devosia lucknowensis TaxID=1096929 RepID=A0A1Y6FDF1_9HYPH|nr:GntR family transcriptional regulator [Devosia lucknowensis]SMQ72855.1 DNA-binding transcriptional regulator YhcF, GntR family [Devosia lucknowensis]
MFSDHAPIYRQIGDRIRADIVTGTLGADQQVMSTNQYASFYGINPATAAKAFQDLIDEGLLYKRRGVGMFVSPDAREKLLGVRRARFFQEHVEPMIAEAKALGMSLDDIAAHVRAAAQTQPKTSEKDPK